MKHSHSISQSSSNTAEEGRLIHPVVFANQILKPTQEETGNLFRANGSEKTKVSVGQILFRSGKHVVVTTRGNGPIVQTGLHLELFSWPPGVRSLVKVDATHGMTQDP